MKRIVVSGLLIFLVIAASGCGGPGSGSPASSGSQSGSQSNTTSVVVTPSGIGEVWQGATVQFTAQVKGRSDQAVTWSVGEGKGGGTIDSTGLYTAPSVAGTFHVVATSHADPKASGIASVEVPPLTVEIFPPSEILRIGGQRLFSGFAVAANQNVTWRLKEGAAGGNITADGLYTAPTTTGTFHLIATSAFNTSVSSRAPVTIVTNGFVPIGDMGIRRSGHTATLLRDGQVLVAGGTRDATHSAELFAPALSSFASGSHGMVHVRSGHCAALLPDGRVLIVGGGDSKDTLFKTAELFDPATQRFTATGDLNQARSGATATLLPGGEVLIAGGQDSQGTLLSTAELYNPATGRFSATGDMHSPRAQHTATLLASGKVLLVGSISEPGSTELFDPASGLFSATGSLIRGRVHHTATLLQNGRVLVLGGTHTQVPEGGGAPPTAFSLDGAEIYDPTKGVFQTAGKLLLARDSHSATLLANGTVLVAGGYSHGADGDAQPAWYTMSAAELFDPSTSASTAAASLEAERAEHVATLVSSGQILVTGGITGFLELCCHPQPYIVRLRSAELYK
jgi:hypothetical protein